MICLNVVDMIFIALCYKTFCQCISRIGTGDCKQIGEGCGKLGVNSFDTAILLHHWNRCLGGNGTYAVIKFSTPSKRTKIAARVAWERLTLLAMLRGRYDQINLFSISNCKKTKVQVPEK